MHETLAKTSLGALEPGARVNLERAVTPTTRLGGHIVQGHVDGTGTVVRRTPSEHWELVEIALPADLERYLVAKGSITVDGISLTVVEVGAGDRSRVSLIPETLARTTLGFKQPGDVVNLEVDVIAKYVEKMVRADERTRASPARARSASTASRTRSPTSPPARRSWSSTTRTARTRATSSSPPARRRRS